MLDSQRKIVRESNFELLRIILMLLIIAGHCCLHNDLKTLGNSNYYITNILLSFSVCAVNAFIIISGYFGINLNINKLVKIDIRVVFYTYVLAGTAVVFGIHQFNLVKDIKLLMPVLTKQYWFITDYFVLCIISPLLNKILKTLDKNELRKALIIGFIIFYAIATLCYLINADQIVMDAGYGIVNFVYLYFLGYYIRNYYSDRHKPSFYGLIYLISGVGLFSVNILMSKLLQFYFNALISYNSIFVLIEAVSLFLCFKNISIKPSKLVNKFSSKALYVYVIHMHPLVSSFLFENVLEVQKYYNGWFVIVAIVIPFLLYVVCFGIDCIVDLILYPLDRIADCFCKKAEKLSFSLFNSRE